MKRPLLFLGILFVISFTSTRLCSQSNGFTSAYDLVHQQFSAYYPFSHWKAIKWDELNSKIRPKIVSASASNDSVAFYTALKEYIMNVPDGHISIHGWDKMKALAKYRQIGGSYGFVLSRLDDGRKVSRLIYPGSPADQAGMQFGAVITEINDQPVNSVLDTLPVWFGEDIPATMEYKRLQQARLIGRAGIGKTMKVRFLNRGSSNPLTATLTAVDDNYATYDLTTMTLLDPGPVVSSHLIQPENFGYVKLTMEHGEDSAAAKKVITDFRDVVANFNNSDVRGMILDMRINAGGEDAIATAISGLFIKDTTFYEYWGILDTADDSIKIYQQMLPMYKPVTLQKYVNPAYPLGSMYIEPQGTYFSKPVVVLVGPRNISTGEGLPLALRNLPDCKILGFYGTNGSFGVNSYSVHFFPSPDDLTLNFPAGVSMDKNQRIQVDSDSTMMGGIIPGIRVPVNDSVIDELYIDSTDVEVNYATRELTSMLGVNNPSGSVNELVLEQNVPNPFESSTSISYDLQYPSFVKLELSDIYGRKLRTIVSAEQNRGRYTVHFAASGLSPGIYFYCIIAGNRQVVRKCIIK